MPSPARSDRTQTQLAGVAGRGLGDDVSAPTRAVIDESQLDQDVADAATDLASHAAADLAAAVHGFKGFIAVEAAIGDGDPGPLAVAVTGVAVGDAIVYVGDLTIGGNVLSPDTAEITAPDEVTITGYDGGATTHLFIVMDLT